MGVRTRTYLFVLAAAIALVGISLLLPKQAAACSGQRVCCGPRHALHACTSPQAGEYVLVQADAAERYDGHGSVCVVTNIRSELPNSFERLNVSGRVLYRSCMNRAEILFAEGKRISMAVFGRVPDSGAPFVSMLSENQTMLFHWGG